MFSVEKSKMTERRKEYSMSIGAKDYIDQLLVQKYAAEKVDNHDGVASMVEPEKMMEAMTDYANMSRNMFALNQKLSNACYALRSKGAHYRKAPTPIY